MLDIGQEGLKALNTYSPNSKNIYDLAEGLKDRKANLDAKKLDEGLEQFESYFINMMFKEMRKSVPKYDNYLTGGKEHKMFQEMMDEKVSEDMAKNGGLGLKDLIKSEVARLNIINGSKDDIEEKK